MIHSILTWLDGKKSTILAIVSAIISYAVAASYLKADLGALLQTVVSILAGGAIVATNKLGIGKK